VSTESDRSKSESSEDAAELSGVPRAGDHREVEPSGEPVADSNESRGSKESGTSEVEDKPRDDQALASDQAELEDDLDDDELEDDELEDDELEDDDSDDYQGDVEPLEESLEEEVEEVAPFEWYILKVQVNRENSICDALRRRVSREGLDEYFRDILVPTEDVVEFTKSGKKRTVKKKLYPGYIMVNMALSEETWFLVRETSGIGDFTGSAGKPTPMDPEEVRRIIKVKAPDQESDEEVRIAIPFSVGDRIRVKEGYFQNFEGDVESIDSANGRVTVMINIFGRSTPVELQHWQMERV
jgi:transcription termination/antitermination protein NusG